MCFCCCFCWKCRCRTRSALLQQICREEAHLPSSADLQVAVHLLTFLHHNLRRNAIGKPLNNSHIELVRQRRACFWQLRKCTQWISSKNNGTTVSLCTHPSQIEILLLATTSETNNSTGSRSQRPPFISQTVVGRWSECVLYLVFLQGDLAHLSVAHKGTRDLVNRLSRSHSDDVVGR